MLLSKYNVRIYLNSSISIAPQQTDKELATNGAIIYPIKYIHWVIGLLDSVSSKESNLDGRRG